MPPEEPIPDSRLGSLTAFAGLLLTLLAPLGANHLGRGHGTRFEIAYLASIVVFAYAALVAVSATYRRRTVVIAGETYKMSGLRRTGTDPELLKEYSGARTGLATVEVQRQLISNIVASITDIIDLNGTKYRLVRHVSVALCVGLLATAAQAGILAL